MAKKKVRFAEGGSVYTPPSKLRMALESVGENISNLPRRTIGVVRDALTIEPTKQQILQHEMANRAALDAEDEPAAKPEGMRRGGRVKSKPRGVGVARKGHGKAMK